MHEYFFAVSDIEFDHLPIGWMVCRTQDKKS